MRWKTRVFIYLVEMADNCPQLSVNQVPDGPKDFTIEKKFITLYDDAERWPVYQNVQFFIWCKNVILNVTTFKYYLHKFVETILDWNHNSGWI